MLLMLAIVLFLSTSVTIVVSTTQIPKLAAGKKRKELGEGIFKPIALDFSAAREIEETYKAIREANNSMEIQLMESWERRFDPLKEMRKKAYLPLAVYTHEQMGDPMTVRTLKQRRARYELSGDDFVTQLHAAYIEHNKRILDYYEWSMLANEVIEHFDRLITHSASFCREHGVPPQIKALEASSTLGPPLIKKRKTERQFTDEVSKWNTNL